MKSSNPISSYIKTWATEEARIVVGNFPLHKSYAHSLVLPLCEERKNLPTLFSHIEKATNHKKTLVICVINQQEKSGKERSLDNKLSLDWLLKDSEKLSIVSSQPPITLAERGHLSLLIIDRWSDGHRFKEGQGVGLARKIGCDIACALINNKKIADHWIRTTDGDARIPKDYFAQKDSTKNTLIYKFRHIQGKTHQAAFPALMAYECWLRYYRLGLVYAKSPNRYHAIGSLISVKAKAYAEVRGFSKKSAGEDFYLLNKLRKIGGLCHHEGQPVELLCRLSDRVPFGTGQGTSKILQLYNQGKDYKVYHPDIFELLKIIFKVAAENKCESGFANSMSQNLNHLDERQTIEDIFKTSQIEKKWNLAVKQAKSAEGARAEFYKSFDSFKILKLVHELRDHWRNNIPLVEALNRSPFLPFNTLILNEWFAWLPQFDEKNEHEINDDYNTP